MQVMTTRRPGLLGSTVMEDVLHHFFNKDFPEHLRNTTSGYPVADIYTDKSGDTVMEFALAGFTRDELSVDIQPEKRSITVSADSSAREDESNERRIAKRSFKKTYINYNDNLDLNSSSAAYENGLLTINVPKRKDAEPISVKIS